MKMKIAVIGAMACLTAITVSTGLRNYMYPGDKVQEQARQIERSVTAFTVLEEVNHAKWDSTASATAIVVSDSMEAMEAGVESSPLYSKMPLELVPYWEAVHTCIHTEQEVSETAGPVPVFTLEADEWREAVEAGTIGPEQVSADMATLGLKLAQFLDEGTSYMQEAGKKIGSARRRLWSEIGDDLFELYERWREEERLNSGGVSLEETRKSLRLATNPFLPVE
jgi:hypothetical protein